MPKSEARRDVARDLLPQQVPKEQGSPLVTGGPAVRARQEAVPGAGPSPHGGAALGAS